MPATTLKKKKSDPEVRVVATRNIVGQAAIAKRFKTTGQAVWNWTQRPDFPAPLPDTDCGRPVWDWEEVQTWERNWVRSKGGWHTHKTHQENGNGSAPRRSRPRRQWMEGDPE